MRKKGICFLLFFCFLIIFCVSCKDSVYEICLREVSEIRENFYFARNEKFVATFTSGKREKDYVLNGKHTEMVDYGVLVVDFVDKNFTTLPDFKLKIDDKIYTGIMEFNPYNGTFCVDIETRITGGENITVFIPSLGLKDDLVFVSEMWQVDSDLAIKIAVSAFDKKIENLIVDGKLQGEIFQKLLSRNRRSAEDMFWNICLFTKNGEILTCTIDVITGQIVAM